MTTYAVTRYDDDFRCTGQTGVWRELDTIGGWSRPYDLCVPAIAGQPITVRPNFAVGFGSYAMSFDAAIVRHGVIVGRLSGSPATPVPTWVAGVGVSASIGATFDYWPTAAELENDTLRLRLVYLMATMPAGITRDVLAKRSAYGFTFRWAADGPDLTDVAQVIFDGQSGVHAPMTGGRPFPLAVGAQLPSVAIVSAALPSTTYAMRSTSVAGRVDSRLHVPSVYVDCGGTSDLIGNQPASTVLAAMVANAAARRAAGALAVVALTVPPATQFTTAQDDERHDLNDAMLASSSFDHVVDVATLLPDPHDVSAYFDGMHWSESSATVVGNAVAPVVGDLLAEAA